MRAGFSDTDAIGSIFLDSAQVTAGRAIEASATGDITISDSTVTSTGGYVALFAGGDVLIDADSSVTAFGNVQITSANDVTLDSALVTAGAAVNILAGGNIFVSDSAPLPGSGIDAGASVTLVAGNDIEVTNSEIEAFTFVIASAANDILIADTATVTAETEHVNLTAASGNLTVQGGSIVEAVLGSIDALAGNDVLVELASVLTAGSSVALTAAAGTLTVRTSSTVRANRGDVLMRAGDDVFVARTALVTTLDLDYAGGDRLNTLTILGDYADTDAAGTTILIEGRIEGQNVLIAGAGDADTIELRRMENLAGHTRILGEGGEDRLIVDELPELATSHNRPGHLLANGSNGAVRDTLDLDGGDGTDAY